MSYRQAVRAIVTAVQRRHELNDVELADRLGCSAGTVRNAKNEHTNLDAVTLATMEHWFGPGTLDPFLALGGSRATPLSDALPDIDPVLDIVKALHHLIAAQHAGSEHGYLLTSQELLAILHELKEARLAFDTLIELAQPGLMAASPEIRQWFEDTFSRPDRLSTRAVPGVDSNAALALPKGFEDDAGDLSAEELATRYGVSIETIESWMRAANERAVTDLDNS